jgi:hypothetical protein
MYLSAREKLESQMENLEQANDELVDETQLSVSVETVSD